MVIYLGHKAWYNSLLLYLDKGRYFSEEFTTRDVIIDSMDCRMNNCQHRIKCGNACYYVGIHSVCNMTDMSYNVSGNGHSLSHRETTE